MAKFKPSHDFKGKEEKKLFKAGEEIEMTIVRAEEVEKNLHEVAKKDIRHKDYANFKMERTDKKDSD